MDKFRWTFRCRKIKNIPYYISNAIQETHAAASVKKQLTRDVRFTTQHILRNDGIDRIHSLVMTAEAACIIKYTDINWNFSNALCMHSPASAFGLFTVLRLLCVTENLVWRGRSK